MEDDENPTPKLSLTILAIFVAILGVAIWRDYDNIKLRVGVLISAVFPTTEPVNARGPSYFGSRK